VLVRMQLSLPRDSRYVGLLRNVADCILTDLNAPEEDKADIRLAVTEACANAVKHAVDSAEYSVALTVSEDACEINVADFGPGFEPPVDLDEIEIADPEIETGRGLLLMQALVDDLRFNREGDGTDLTLVKRWSDMDLQFDAV
jgi:serine/threonine-protein kinase RsbW